MDAESSPWRPTNNPKARRPGRAFRPPYHPWGVPAGWAGERFHLGRNKEVFDAELYAVMRAIGVLLKRQESGKNYCTAAIERVCTD